MPRKGADHSRREAPASHRNRDVDRLLAEIDAPQRPVANAVRELILETGPALEERLMYGVPWYRGKGYLFAIAAHTDHTNLEFARGASLRDPARLLEGTGKNMRHVKLFTVGDVQRPRLKALLREAIRLDSA